MEALGYEILALLFFVGLAAGFVDAIAGGGGLLALPALLAAGLTPVEALATNKLQGSFGTLSASFNFMHKGLVEPRSIVLAIVCTFIGAATGTLLVQQIDASQLATVIPVLLIAAAVYYLLSPRMGDLDCHQRMTPIVFAFLIGTSVGFYDGFFGPGTGSLFAISLVGLLGYNLRKATAHTKILNLTSNIASLLFFIISGKVVWLLGGVMAVGQLFGAYLGSHLVIRHGAGIVRPVLVVVSIAVSLKLLLGD